MNLVLNATICSCNSHPSHSHGGRLASVFPEHFTPGSILLRSVHPVDLPGGLVMLLAHVQAKLASCLSKLWVRLMVVCQYYLFVSCPVLWEEKGVRISLARNLRLKKTLFSRGNSHSYTRSCFSHCPRSTLVQQPPSDHPPRSISAYFKSLSMHHVWVTNQAAEVHRKDSAILTKLGSLFPFVRNTTS